MVPPPYGTFSTWNVNRNNDNKHARHLSNEEAEEQRIKTLTNNKFKSKHRNKIQPDVATKAFRCPKEMEPMMEQVSIQNCMLAESSVISFYVRAIMQFGYISLFAVAFPLAPLLSLINNSMQIPFEIISLASVTHRPLSTLNTEETPDADTMGLIDVVMEIQEFMTYTAVVTNCAILFFTFPNFAEAAFNIGHDDTTTKLWVVIIIEHIVIIIKAFLANCIHDAPKWVLEVRDARASKTVRDSNFELERSQNKNKKLKERIQMLKKNISASQYELAHLKNDQTKRQGRQGRQGRTENYGNGGGGDGDGDDARMYGVVGGDQSLPNNIISTLNEEDDDQKIVVVPEVIDRTQERAIGGGKQYVVPGGEWDNEYGENEFGEYDTMNYDNDNDEEEEEEQEEEQEQEEHEEEPQEDDPKELQDKIKTLSSMATKKEVKEMTSNNNISDDSTSSDDDHFVLGMTVSESKGIKVKETKQERMNRHIETARERRRKLILPPLIPNLNLKNNNNNSNTTNTTDTTSTVSSSAGTTGTTPRNIVFARQHMAQLMQRSRMNNEMKDITSGTIYNDQNGSASVSTSTALISTTAGREAIAKYLKPKKEKKSRRVGRTAGKAVL